MEEMKKKKNFYKIAFYGWFVIALLFVVYAGFNYYSNIPISKLKKEYTYEDSQMMNIVGMRVHYRVTGTGEPLVLLHGTGSSLHTWEEWTKELSGDYQVISLDLPGFGLTGKHFANDYSIKAYTDFLDVFLDKLGVTQINLAGNSLGGHIAWQYALDHANRVKKLILLNSSGFAKEDSEVTLAFRLANIPVVNKLMLRITPKSLIESSLEEVYYNDDKVTEELVNRVHSLQLRRGNRQAFVDKSSYEYADRTEDLKNISCPTLIQWGKSDEWLPVSWAKDFETAIPNARVIIYDQAGHVPMEELPVKTARDARQFLETGSVTPITEG